MSVASFADAGLQLPPLVLECLSRRRVDRACPPALFLALEDCADLRDAMPCPLTFGRERTDRCADVAQTWLAAGPVPPGFPAASVTVGQLQTPHSALQTDSVLEKIPASA